MDYAVGAVSYVNAWPLIHGLRGRVGFELEVPSALPPLLESGRVQSILVSSFHALSQPGLAYAEGCCIGSTGPAESVRLFSKIPFREIQTLALDASSMTTNALARILLAERYHVYPQTFVRPPDQAAMLADCDACVLIGDIGMTAPSDGLWVLDLGEAWTEWTELPFVWALWVGKPDMPEELVGLLNEAREMGEAGLDEIVPLAAASAGWEIETTRRYLGSTMQYHLTRRHLKGLHRFAELLRSNGLIPETPFPAMISTPIAVSS